MTDARAFSLFDSAVATLGLPVPTQTTGGYELAVLSEGGPWVACYTSPYHGVEYVCDLGDEMMADLAAYYAVYRD